MTPAREGYDYELGKHGTSARLLVRRGDNEGGVVWRAVTCTALPISSRAFLSYGYGGAIKRTAVRLTHLPGLLPFFFPSTVAIHFPLSLR